MEVTTRAMLMLGSQLIQSEAVKPICSSPFETLSSLIFIFIYLFLFGYIMS